MIAMIKLLLAMLIVVAMVGITAYFGYQAVLIVKDIFKRK